MMDHDTSRAHQHQFFQMKFLLNGLSLEFLTFDEYWQEKG